MSFKSPLNFRDAIDQEDGPFQVRFAGEIKNLYVEDVIGIIISGQNEKISFSPYEFLQNDEIINAVPQHQCLRIIWRNLDSENYRLEVNFCPLGINYNAHQLILYFKQISKQKK